MEQPLRARRVGFGHGSIYRLPPGLPTAGFCCSFFRRRLSAFNLSRPASLSAAARAGPTGICWAAARAASAARQFLSGRDLLDFMLHSRGRPSLISAMKLIWVGVTRASGEIRCFAQSTSNELLDRAELCRTKREPRLELIAGSVNNSDGSPMALINKEWSRNILEHGDYAVHTAPKSLEQKRSGICARLDGSAIPMKSAIP